MQIEKPATQEKIKQDLLSIFEEDIAMMAGIEK